MEENSAETMEGSVLPSIEVQSHDDWNQQNSQYSPSESGGSEVYVSEAQNTDAESGVEPDYLEWVFKNEDDDIKLDMTTEQTMATLRYFTASSDRANIMTKTHGDDLALISELLTEKEHDLELAAKIGQSLLQRNKTLLLNMEAMEEYLSNAKDREYQLSHELKMKSDLVKVYLRDEDEYEEHQSPSHSSTTDERELNNFDKYSQGSCTDEDMRLLSRRCQNLEDENQQLFAEALGIRDVTEEVEEQENQLVMNCINQLSEAKGHITKLTDEIAMKFEDNIQQQDEISQLISMVCELQNKQKQLSVENNELNVQLDETRKSKGSLEEQLSVIQEKYMETYELLQNQQQELKALKERAEFDRLDESWQQRDQFNSTVHDSIVDEIEESVRARIAGSQDGQRLGQQLATVRAMNSHSYCATSSGRTSPVSNWSLASDEWSASDVIKQSEVESSRVKKPVKKLQIVKPLEGSDTLHKWHHLASHSMKDGLSITSVDSTAELSLANLIGATGGIPETDDSDSGFVRGSPVVDPTASTPAPVAETVEQKTSSTPQKSPIGPRTTVARSGPQTLLAGLATPGGRSRGTIITRNSAALRSVRNARKLLTQDDATAGHSKNLTTGAPGAEPQKSKAEVIDLIASAMSKVNVEAKAGQRILRSLNQSKDQEQAPVSATVTTTASTTTSTSYHEMPAVARIFEKYGDEAKPLAPLAPPSPPTSEQSNATDTTTSPPEPEPVERINAPHDLDLTKPVAQRLARATAFRNPLLRSAVVVPPANSISAPVRTSGAVEAGDVVSTVTAVSPLVPRQLGFGRAYSSGSLANLARPSPSRLPKQQQQQSLTGLLDLLPGNTPVTAGNSHVDDELAGEIDDGPIQFRAPSRFVPMASADTKLPDSSAIADGDTTASPVVTSQGGYFSNLFFGRPPAPAMLKRTSSAGDVTTVMRDVSSLDSTLDRSDVSERTTASATKSNSGGGGISGWLGWS